MRRAQPSQAEQVAEWVYRDSGVSRPEVWRTFLSDPMNVCLIEGEGGAVFIWRGPGIYEVHLFFEQRGRAAIELIRRMFKVMRSKFGARLMWAAIPIESRKVIMFARLVGWKSQGVAELAHGHCELFQSE